MRTRERGGQRERGEREGDRKGWRENGESKGDNEKDRDGLSEGKSHIQG